MEEKTKYYLKIFSKFAIFAFILLCLFVLYKLTLFYMPFVIALIIASIAEPLIRFFMKKCKMKRKFASIVSLLIIISIIVTIFGVLISNIITEATKLVENLNIYATDAYNAGMQFFNDAQEGKIEIPDKIIEIAKKSYSGFLDSAKEFIGNFLTGFLNVLGAIPTVVTFTIITFLATIFICFDREYIIKTCKKHIPSKWLKKLNRFAKETFNVSGNYIKAEAKLSSMCFVLMFIGLLIMQFAGLGVEFPILMAILIGFVDIIPIFGTGIVMVPWVICLFISGNFPLAIGVFILWSIWTITKNLLEPKMISKEMGLHPIFTLLAMYTGLQIFGILGLMLGPILLLVFKNIFSELVNRGILKSIFEQE